MSGRRSLSLVIVLALTAVAGLIVMLVADAWLWDRLGFVLTALPLAVGLLRVSARQARRRDDPASGDTLFD